MRGPATLLADRLAAARPINIGLQQQKNCMPIASPSASSKAAEHPVPHAQAHWPQAELSESLARQGTPRQ